MKNLLFSLPLVFCFAIANGQETSTYESATYINGIAAADVPRFIELHKKFADLAVGENRLATGEWLFRHWYGSGHTFVIYDQYNSMEDYMADSELYLENIKAKIDAMKDESEVEAIKKDWVEYRAFSDGHTDEIRVSNSKTGFLTLEDVNFDVPFVMVVGSYNSSGNWSKMGNAFFDWRIKPEVEIGSSIAGGVSYHYMGSGPEVEVWQCYNSLVDFATSVTSTTPQSDAAKESSKTFWSLVSGSHEDQIYLHIGHVDTEKGVFDLAGPNK
ncbi:hypothetical protein OAM55_01420 [Flavobacteriaceae bacterium]|nr:hypothetical protein [Flavobacteriaceae bacterium]